MMQALSLFVIISIIAGSIFALILNTNDKSNIIKSVQKFINNTQSGHYNYLDSMKNVLVNNSMTIILIWILGLSMVGIIIIILFIFWKAFCIGFTISSFIITFGIKGLLLSIVYLFPSIIINILIFMYLSSYAVYLSLVMIKCILGKKKLDFKLFMHNYAKVLFISLIGIIISGIYEIVVNPYLLKIISNLI